MVVGGIPKKEKRIQKQVGYLLKAEAAAAAKEMIVIFSHILAVFNLNVSWYLQIDLNTPTQGRRKERSTSKSRSSIREEWNLSK